MKNFIEQKCLVDLVHLAFLFDGRILGGFVADESQEEILCPGN